MSADLPAPEDEFDRKLVSDVREHGWHCVLVANEHHPEHVTQNTALGSHPIYDAAFAYTVGLWLTKQHSEIALVGRWQHSHAIISAVVDLIDEGQSFVGGDTSEGVLPELTVRFDPVSDERRQELLTYASWANRRQPFQAVQLVLPDPAGRWPEDPGYHGHPQPLIG
jgi:hypothetical protein